MSEPSIIIQAAELLTTKPFEMIMNYFKNKQEKKKALVELLTDACVETQMEINNIKSQKSVPPERQREVAKYWSKVCAELMIAYPPISGQFHAKAVSWASANSWTKMDIMEAEANLKTIEKFVMKLSGSS
jgi:hypothetical protein